MEWYEMDKKKHILDKLYTAALDYILSYPLKLICKHDHFW